jgi:ferredoxin
VGHLTRQRSHRVLRNQLDRYPLGAPGETLVFEILETLFSAEEAALAAQLPLGFATLAEIAAKLEPALPPAALEARLEALAQKGLVVDLRIGDRTRYCLPPTLVGLFEFSMMRVRDDVDQRELARLFHRYLVEEPEYFLQLAGSTVTPFRTLVHEETIPPDHSEVLDYERATRIVGEQELLAVGICHCRHVAHHLDRPCERFELRSCLSFGSISDYLVRRGFAEPIERGAALELVARAKAKGLVHIGDNVRQEPNFLCNCCRCCCEVLASFRNFDFFTNTFSSNFEAAVTATDCQGCQQCVRACPVEAIGVNEAGRSSGRDKAKGHARVDRDVCIGCGVCIPSCKHGALEMRPRSKRRIVPEDTIARTVLMALDRGTLQDLLVDRHASMSSAAIAALLKAIPRLPVAKQLLAREALRSRFVDLLLAWR